jgi:hypothetical protein
MNIQTGTGGGEFNLFMILGFRVITKFEHPSLKGHRLDYVLTKFRRVNLTSLEAVSMPYFTLVDS